MSCTIKPLFKALSIANGCQFSLPAIFSTKTSHPYLSIPLPSQPIKLHLSFSISSSPTPFFTINKTTHISTVAAFAAQTDWAQQGTNTAVTEDEDEEPGVDAIGDAGESGGKVGFEEGEESYPEPPEEAKVYVGNLDYGVDSETLAQVFEQAGVVEIAEVKYNRQTDQSQGYAFVTMRTVEEADKAIEMFHRYDLNGRLLVVNKAAPIGTRPERQERPPRTTEPTYSAFVSNFPWDTNDEHLEQLFSKHGKVLDARVVYDRESGRSRGFGFVKMSTEAELNDAIAKLHGQSVGGREIRVHPAGEKPRQSF